MNVIIALARHSACTNQELRSLCREPKRSIIRATQYLQSLGVIIGYPWRERYPQRIGSPQPKFKPTMLVWELDRRHPWIWLIRRVGRRLSNGFPLPGEDAIAADRGKRPAIGPKAPWSDRGYTGATPQPTPFALYGQTAQHDLIMFLAHVGANGAPITKVAKLLGLSRFGAMKATDVLEEFGVITSTWQPGEIKGLSRRLRLDPSFCAARALRKLAQRIDKDFGRMYEDLAYQRKVDVATRSLHRYRARLRRHQSKPKIDEAASPAQSDGDSPPE